MDVSVIALTFLDHCSKLTNVSCVGSESTEIFDKGFLYLLVGEVGGTKNELGDTRI